MTDNLQIWNHAEKIDPAYCKPDNNGGYSSLSLSGYWMIKKLTELWGPIGDRWGYKILEERKDEGQPIYHIPSLASDKPFQLTNQITLTIKLELYYPGPSGEKATVVNYGHTKYIYQLNNGKVKTDEEAPKKSLTDALKKCMSMLGVAGAVYLGEYDNKDYMDVVATEFDIEKQEEKEAIIDDKVKEVKSLVTSNVKAINEAPNPNASYVIYQSILKTLRMKMKITSLNDVCSKGIAKIEDTYTKKQLQFKEASNATTNK